MNKYETTGTLSPLGYTIPPFACTSSGVQTSTQAWGPYAYSGSPQNGLFMDLATQGIAQSYSVDYVTALVDITLPGLTRGGNATCGVYYDYPNPSFSMASI